MELMACAIPPTKPAWYIELGDYANFAQVVRTQMAGLGIFPTHPHRA
jgi:hypothetical protein